MKTESGEEKSDIQWQSDDKSRLNKALAACAAVQRTYGKQADFENASPIFIRILSKYEPAKVIEAIRQWITKSSEFPTPHDIIEILEAKPKLDRTLYIRAQKVASDHEGGFSHSWDRKSAAAYCSYYEREMLGEALTTK